MLSFFPKHHSYLEPFFGSGAVLFSKPRSHIETINDLDGNVVNLFEWIKKDPEKLAHEIYYTPYSRQAYENSYAAVQESSLEQAVNFCIRLNMGHGFRTNDEKVGWKNDIQGRAAQNSSRGLLSSCSAIVYSKESLPCASLLTYRYIVPCHTR